HTRFSRDWSSDVCSSDLTSDFVYTWNEIYSILGHAAGAEPKVRHATTDAIEQALPDRAGQLAGDMAHSVVFDNTKIRSLVPDFKIGRASCRERVEIGAVA